MLPDLDGSSGVPGELLESPLEITRPSAVGREHQLPPCLKEGDPDFKDGGEPLCHFTRAWEGDLAHEPSIAEGRLLKAPQGFPSLERGNPDGQSKGGQKHEGGERNDKTPVETSPANWIISSQSAVIMNTKWPFPIPKSGF